MHWWMIFWITYAFLSESQKNTALVKINQTGKAALNNNSVSIQYYLNNEEKSKSNTDSSAHTNIGIVVDAVELDAFSKLLNSRAGGDDNKEIILLQSDLEYFDLTLNVIMDLEQLQLYNYVVYMENSENCDAVLKVWPSLGCVWFSLFLQDHPSRYWHKIRHMWMVRWILFAKMSQLGYNVLMIDSDMAVRHNPYKFLKNPPFGKYNLIVAFEGGYPGINCGSVYAQNLDPNGVVVWMASEVAERTLRWLEEPEFLIQKLGTDHEWAMEDALFEQSIFMDAACSAFHGKPLFYHSFRPPEMLQDMKKKREDWDKLHWPLCNEDVAWNSSIFSLDEKWKNVSGELSQTFKWKELKMPKEGYEYDVKFGGQPFPQQRGIYSNRLQDYLTKGVYEDFSTNQTQEVETIVQAPLWLFSRWPEWGRYGYWEQDPPRAVLAHTVLTQGRDGQGKYAPLKLLGWWHWEAEQIARTLNSKEKQEDQLKYQKFVAFVPQVRIKAESKEAVWKLLQDSIIKIGMLSNRRVVWPSVDCDSPWIRKSPGNSHPHNVQDPGIVVYGSQRNQTCYWFGLMSKGCHQVGIAEYDFHHYFENVDTNAEYYPNANNTILIEDTKALYARQAQVLLQQYEDVQILFMQNVNLQIIGFPREQQRKVEQFYNTCQPPPIP